MVAEDKNTVNKKSLTLVDGSGFIFRAYYALPPLTRNDGTPINAVMGYCNMIWRLIAETKTSSLAVIFDTASKSFRNEIYSEYKANRSEAPEDLIPQFSLIREATEAFNIPYIELKGYEADDIIATYSNQASNEGWTVDIISSDKDLMQLVNDNVKMVDPMKMVNIGREEVFKKFGVYPEKVIDVQALAGDSTDNIPGVPGIGIKTAAELINEYGDLDTLLGKAEEIKQPKRRENLINYADLARISMKLVTLSKDIKEIESFNNFKRRDIDINKLKTFLIKQGFNSLIGRLPNEDGFIDSKSAYVALPEDNDKEDIKPIKKNNYKLVTDEQVLVTWLKNIEINGIVSIDTETTSIDAVSAQLVGISLSIEPGNAIYIPLNHKSKEGGLIADKINQLDTNLVLSLLKPILEDPSIIKIGQNIKYDMTVLYNAGDINIYPYHDTMLMSFALDAGKQSGHGMDSLSKKHLNITPISYSEITGKGKDQVTFDYVALEKALEYAAQDADITLRLYIFLKDRLVKENMVSLYETIERPLPNVIAYMERNGVGINSNYLKNLSNTFINKMNPIKEKIFNLADEEFNISSPKQLAEILYNKLGLKGGKKGKSGLYSTSAAVLEKLSQDGNEICQLILEWRALQKLKSTYSDALVDQINPVTKRVHTHFQMTGAMTGRFSSSNPNLQNIPIKTEDGRAIRRAFIAEENKKIVACDYSQIELRLLAEVANIEPLIKAFKNNVDVHTLTASQVFIVDKENVTSAMRRNAKTINFGIIYGQSAFGLAKQLNISRTEAKEYIELYFNQYPGIKKYMENTQDFARRNGFVETIYGRRCYIPSINDKNPMIRAGAERQAINAPLQGAAADIIKRSMKYFPEILIKNNIDAKLILQVHDELVFECASADVDRLIAIVKSEMINAPQPGFKMKVPLEVEIGIGDNWDEAH
ncbi:MAG: DNA polymerase I [Alphaproteobacteria bacterium]|nr:MAG: DNA polymerase I [Alphaproteobacteria bacterium]|tara:strand:+ start:10195 stop:12993 length:2799 start_codon:yes stop_codon:yes gene_type:complete